MNGQPIIIDGLRMVFFLDRQACDDIRPVVNVVTSIVDGLGADRFRFFVNDDGDCQPLPRDAAGFARRTLLAQEAGADFVGLRWFDTDLQGSEWELGVSHEPTAVDRADGTWEKRAGQNSYLVFRMSTMAAMELGFDAIVRFVSQACSELPFHFAYANPVLAYGGGVGSIEAALPVAKRHAGFDIAHPLAVASDLDDRPAGVYWLNALNASIVTKLGGADVIRRALPPDIDVLPLAGGGMLVRLGAAPAVGDLNARADLPLHRALAALFAPLLRVPRTRYIPDADDPFTTVERSRWHQRFLPTGGE